MPKASKNIHAPRNLAVSLLIKTFAAEYRSLMGYYKPLQQLELTEHLISLLACLQQYAENNKEDIYKEFLKAEDALLKKYGRQLKAYKGFRFEKYFATDIILTEKEIISAEEFNRLTAEEQGLTVPEVLRFVQVCTNVLHTERQILLLDAEPSFDVKESTVNDLSFNVNGNHSTDIEFTKSRQLLALHYLLNAGFGIEPRTNTSVSALARFAHLITGTPLSGLQNSEIYKKYRLMPNLKKGIALINDLQYIRPFFKELGIDEAVKQIDAEIAREKKEIALENKPAK